MLITPGDLIPVLPAATAIPWTRRKSQILNFLHRGPVTFRTLVYDTNVGDISALATYFNPERVSVKDLNSRFGQYPNSGEDHKELEVKVGSEQVVKPRLLLYPEHNLNNTQVKVQRTLKWVLSHQDSEDSSDLSRPSSTDLLQGHLSMAERRGLNEGIRLREVSGSTTSAASSECINLTKGSRPGSASRLSPIGQPLDEPSSSSSTSPTPIVEGEMTGQQQGRLAHTMPNLNSMLDSVWRDEGMRHSSQDTWGSSGSSSWKPTRCPW